MDLITIGYGNSLKYLDQIDGNTWIYARSFRKYLFNKYNYSLEDYYNLIVNGSPNYRPKCPYCDLPLKWIDPSSMKGYRLTCDNPECRHKQFLSTYVPTIESRRQSSDYSDYRKTVSDRLKDCHALGYYDYTKSINSLASTVNRCYSNLMNLNHSITTYFYLMYFDTQFKYGVTQDIRSRLKYHGYPKYDLIYQGDLILCSNLERDIKFELNTSSEYLDMSYLGRVEGFIDLYFSSIGI